MTGNLDVLSRAGVDCHLGYFSTEGRAHDPADPRLTSKTASVAYLGARKPQEEFSRLGKVSHKIDFLVRGILGIPGKRYPFSMRYDAIDAESIIIHHARRTGCTHVVIPSFCVHYARGLRKAGLTPVADAIDVMTDLSRRLWKAEGNFPPQLGLFANYVASRTQERRYLPDCPEIWATSDAEEIILKSMAPESNVFVIPNTVDENQIQRTNTPGSNAVGFIGNYTLRPNLEAAKFLALQVMPIVRNEIPEARLLLAGSGLPESVASEMLAAGQVSLLGAVNKSSELFDKSDVVALPVRVRGGVPLKLVEAFARWRPVVATPEIVAGLGLEDGQELYVRSTAEDFAFAIVRLLRDKAEQEKMSARARERFMAVWSRDAAARVFRAKSILARSVGTS